MALRAVTDHPKFFRLKLLLKLNKSCALGYLEAMWHFCGKYTPQGNIGKYSDADIEAWLEWDGNEGELVAACVKAGWLRVDEAHRLIVHDWSQYADEIVHTDLARKCLRFADGAFPKTGRLNKHERARYAQAFPGAHDSQQPATPEDVDSGSQTESDTGQTESDTSQTKPDMGTKPEPEPEPEPEPARTTAAFELPAWIDREAWQAFEEHRRKRRAPLTSKARKLCVRKLEKMRKAGYDPADVLNQSTMNGWTGLFEPKGEKRGFTQQNRGNQRIADQLDELRKAGVTVPDGVPEDGPGEVCDPARRGDGRDAPGVVLEGTG